MGRKAMKKAIKDYRQEYLDSNSWRCPDAPINKDIPLQVKYNTGAHHWIGRGNGEFYCKYCFELRLFNHEARLGYNNKRFEKTSHTNMPSRIGKI